MPQISTLQTAIEAVEALSIDDQNLLFELIHKRRITQRRQEIAQRAIDVTDAIKNGTAKIGTVEELIADVFGDDDE
jgi:hypothetical protein